MLAEEAIDESQIGSAAKSVGRAVLLILNIALLGIPIMRRKKSTVKKKKKCDYCDSDLIFPDTPQNREFSKSFTHKH